MNLELCLPSEHIITGGRKIPFFKKFYGQNVEQMPKLIADGRVPMSVAQLMQRRLVLKNYDDTVESSYRDNYFDTGDAVVYHPDGRVKIVFDALPLREMTPKSRLNNGRLILTNDIYDSLQGEEFKYGELGKINCFLSKKEVKAHPVWRVLLRHPDNVPSELAISGLLEESVDYIFAEGKERFGYDAMMGVYPDSASDEVEMRAWVVNGLEGRSFALGRIYLDCGTGLFIGIAPEATQFFW